MVRNTSSRLSVGSAISIILLAAVAVAGVAGLLYFWRALLKPGDLGAMSLPLVALVAGVAATFNPCGLPALPGFFAFGGQAIVGTRRKGELCLAASLGAVSAVVLLGIPVALLGTQVKDVLSPHFRWVQLAVGAFLALLAVAHLAGQTTRLPLVGSLTELGGRIWERSLGLPTGRASYLFGAGFVAVGATWTLPFLAAVAVFALGIGGFVASLSAFVIFALTMGVLVFLLAFLGAGSAQALAQPLRVWGRRVQVIAALIIALVGVGLVLEGINPDFLDELLLG